MKAYILGTDWWTDCDDVVAMRLLSRAHRRGEIKVRGIGINAAMADSVASLDGFLHTEGVDDIPLGLDADATDFGGRPPYQGYLSQFAVRYRTNTDAENAVSLYRRLLAESQEKIEIIEVGFLQVIAAVLESEGDAISPKTGLELFRERVSHVWVMAGKWDEEGGRENNFARNPRARRAAESFCRLCPTPVTFLGFEVGVDVITGGHLPETDVLGQVLRLHGSRHGRSSWDPMLTLLALIGDVEKAGYRAVTGWASVDSESGANTFHPDPAGLHRYVIKQKENAYYEAQLHALL